MPQHWEKAYPEGLRNDRVSFKGEFEPHVNLQNAYL